MPFTLAHPAIVLPARRSGLPLAALVWGSLVPDLPLYVPGGGLLGGRDEAHSWTHTWPGLVAFCLPVGVLVTVVWVLLLQEPLLDMAPAAVHDRVRLRRRPDLGYWLWTLPAVALGAVTHLGWDQITHDPSWTTRHVSLLSEDVGGMPGARWLMYLSSILGMAFVAWVVRVELVRRRAIPAPRRVPALAPLVVSVPSVAAALAGVYRLVTVGPYVQGLHALTYEVLTAALAAGAVAVLALCLAWHVWPRPADGGDGATGRSIGTSVAADDGADLPRAAGGE